MLIDRDIDTLFPKLRKSGIAPCRADRIAALTRADRAARLNGEDGGRPVSLGLHGLDGALVALSQACMNVLKRGVLQR